MAAELLASRNTNSLWPEISRDAWISERTAQRWASTEMTPTAQHDRRDHPGRPGKLTNDEKEEILARAREQRAEHGVIDTSWTRAMMAEVTDDRIPSATDSSISRFWQRAEWPTR
jgi:transposase